MQILSVELFSTKGDGTHHLDNNYLTLPDWIWDCQCNKDDESHASVTVTVALAHGSVQLWKLQLGPDAKSVQLQHMRTITCQPPSLVQALRIYHKQVAMAQDGAILVLSLDHPTCVFTIKVPIAGTMHALRFDDSGERLASVSNDRSVRLWEYHPDETWQERWTVWGHTARVWDVAFVQHDQYVVSTGGDNTIRLWNAENGTALHLWYTQRCMRSMDTYHTWIAAGGEDGTVVIYNVDAYRQPVLDYAAHLTRQKVSSLPNSNTCRFTVPDDRPAISLQSPGENGEETSEAITKSALESMVKKGIKQKKTKVSKQVLVGAEFCTLETQLFILVATRMGSLFVLDLRTGSWSQQADWETRQNAKDGCCMKTHPDLPIVAIGSTNGLITIVQINNLSGAMATKTTLDDASHYRAVQALEWIDSTTLVTYHIHTVIFWTFSHLSSTEISPDSYHCLILEAHTKGMVICGAFNKERNLFAAGDTRGNLILFELEQRFKVPTKEPLHPVSCLPYCHRKEHINALVWVNQNKIFSVGNDGCIAETLVTIDCKLEPLMAVPSGQLKAITHIFQQTKGGLQTKGSGVEHIYESCRFGDIFIAGYLGNRFSLLDAKSGYELANVNTGGRQRSLEVHLPTGLSQTSLTAVRESKLDGRIDIVVAACGVHKDGMRGKLEKRHDSPDTMISSVHGMPLHNDSIFGLCLFPVTASCQQVAVISASEDCFMTASIFQDEKLVAVKRLPPMVSGVRAVCSSSSTEGQHLLAFGGGQLEIMFYICDSNHLEGDLFPLLSFIGCGIPTEKQLIDQRINAMKAVFLTGTAFESRHLVVTGDSGGACCMYFVAEEKSRRTIGYTFFRSERPILSIEMWKDGDAIFIIAGTTDGFLYVFEACEKLLRDVEKEGTHLCPILTYRGHSMGTNAIAARMAPPNELKKLRIASVGDDQAICCCDIRVQDSRGHAVIVSQIVKPGASLSAMKGVEWTSNHTLVTVGYDQRVVHWNIADEIVPLSVTPVSIGDVNCLGKCRGPRRTVVAVGGAGVELLCLKNET
jgi:WD40 repeat protein